MRDRQAALVAAAILDFLARRNGGWRFSKIIGLQHTKRAVQFVIDGSVFRYRVTITRERNE